MECPKFIPNIFNKTKCSQCFKIQEEHFSYRRQLSSSSTIDTVDSSSAPSPTSPSISCERTALKCGHLFIAPQDYLPHDHHFKNKRWQRRWFILYDNGELSYSIDEHPDAIPQGIIDLNTVSEISGGEELIGHQYSILLKSNEGVQYLKGSTVDEYKKWIKLFTKYCANTVAVSPIRRSSSSCASTVSVGEETGPKSPQIYSSNYPPPSSSSPDSLVTKLPKVISVETKARLGSYVKHTQSATPDSLSSKPPKYNLRSNSSSNKSHLLRGDPDGGEQILIIDSSKISSLPLSPTSSSSSSWSPPEKIKNNINSLKNTTSSSNNPPSQHTSPNSITNLKNCQNISPPPPPSPKSPPPPPSSQNSEFSTVSGVKLRNLKSCLSVKKNELEALNADSILKSDKLLIDNLKLQLNSYFIEIDKLAYLLNYKYSELREEGKEKENEINELRSRAQNENVLTGTNEILCEENKLLVERINDLTEKYYSLDKNYKIMKSKLHKYRTNSLKDKDLVENEVFAKIKALESKIGAYLPQCGENSHDTSAPHTPNNSSEEKKGLINVILKLNELDKRLESSGSSPEWYKCSNCEHLQNEIHHRDLKLNELETMVNNLESSLNYINRVKLRYNEEVKELRELCLSSVRSLESSYDSLVRELSAKHTSELLLIGLSKEKELEEESRATKNALELLKKNYESELNAEVGALRSEFLTKYNHSVSNVREIHAVHEEEVRGLKEQLVELAEKYSNKCLEMCEMEDTYCVQES